VARTARDDEQHFGYGGIGTAPAHGEDSGDELPLQVTVYEITVTSTVYQHKVYFRTPAGPQGYERIYLSGIFEYVPQLATPVVVASYTIPCGCGPLTPYLFVSESSEAASQSLAPMMSMAATPSTASTCQGGCWGDPHLIRFDHVGEAIPGAGGEGRFDFQASGEFVLFESTDDSMVVQVRYEPANDSTTVTRAAAMDVEGDRVSVYPGSALDVRIGGVPTALTVGIPVILPGGGELERGTSPAGRDELYVRWLDGSELRVVEWSTPAAGSYLNLFPTLAVTRSAGIQGLLGNANGIVNDDLNLGDGTPANPADLYTTFADSWRITQIESLFDYAVGEDTTTWDGTPTDPDYTVADLDPVAVAAATADCNAAGIVDEPWLSQCIIDVVVLAGSGAAGAGMDAQSEVPGFGVYVNVPAKSNLFGAGLSSVPDFGDAGTGNGILPPLVNLPAGVGRIVRILDATGNVRFLPPENPACGPDGKVRPMSSWGTWGVSLGHARRPVARSAPSSSPMKNARRSRLPSIRTIYRIATWHRRSVRCSAPAMGSPRKANDRRSWYPTKRPASTSGSSLDTARATHRAGMATTAVPTRSSSTSFRDERGVELRTPRASGNPGAMPRALSRLPRRPRASEVPQTKKQPRKRLLSLRNWWRRRESNPTTTSLTHRKIKVLSSELLSPACPPVRIGAARGCPPALSRTRTVATDVSSHDSPPIDGCSRAHWGRRKPSRRRISEGAQPAQRLKALRKFDASSNPTLRPISSTGMRVFSRYSTATDRRVSSTSCWKRSPSLRRRR